MPETNEERIMKIVISEPNPGAADTLRHTIMRLVAGGVKLEIVGWARDGLEVAQMAAHLQPDFMFITAEMPGIDGFEGCKLAAAANPDTICVMIVDDPGTKAMAKAMRCGARAVVSPSQPEADLRKLFDELVTLREAKNQPEYAIATDPEKLPVSIAITAPKGGLGKTEVAVNLAVVLAKRYPDQVVLVDFYGQYGNVASSLDLQSTPTIADLLMYQQLDVDLVQGHLIKHKSGLKILPGVQQGTQETLDDIGIPQLAAMLGMLRRRNRFTIFDLPPFLWPASQYIMSRCQQIFVLSQLDDFPAMRATASFVKAITHSNVPEECIHLVLNRVGKTTGFITRENVEKATGIKVWAEIPDAPQIVNTARNVGEPFVISHEREKIASVFNDMARRLMDEVAASQTVAK